MQLKPSFYLSLSKKLIDFFSQRLTIPKQKPITNRQSKMFSTKSLKIQRTDSSVFTFEELEFNNIEGFQEFLKCFENKTTNIIPASSDSESDLLDMAFIQESNSPNENTQQASPKSGSSSYNRAYYEKRKNNPAFKSKNAAYAKEYYLKHKDDPEYKRKKSESSKRRRQEKKAQNTITIQAEA